MAAVTRLPITAFFPVYECRDRLQVHLDKAKEWLPLVEAIVVVDSFSRDGTLEVARSGISHPYVRFFEQPPGLYEAWNFGISQVESDYVYISTISDHISKAGLEHLAQTAISLEADVVISPPLFRNMDGNVAADKKFPLHYLLARSRISKPFVLDPLLATLLKESFKTDSLLGSSASNLYKTSFLKADHFPTNFEKAGDLIWFERNVLRGRIAITPETCAEFLLHQEVIEISPDTRLALLEELERANSFALNEYCSQRGVEDTANVRFLVALPNALKGSPRDLREISKRFEIISKIANEQKAYIAELKDHISNLDKQLEERGNSIDQLHQECQTLRQNLKKAQCSSILTEIKRMFYK